MAERIIQDGEFGKDYISGINGPGRYEIPIIYYDYEFDDALDDAFEKWVEVEITQVVKPPVSRYMLIIGYDENNKSQMWYYNGSENCFKRIWQGGFMGDRKTLNKAITVLKEDADINDKKLANELANHFMSL